VFEHGEVLHERGQGHGERAGEFGGTGRSDAEPFDDGEPGRVGQCLEGRS
jgi:hypothetical protein